MFFLWEINSHLSLVQKRTCNWLIFISGNVIESNVQELYERPLASPSLLSLLSTIAFHENNVTVLVCSTAWFRELIMLTTSELQQPFWKMPIQVTAMIRLHSSGLDEFSRLRVTKELLFVEEATFGEDLRWICPFLGRLLAFECGYFLSFNPPFLECTERTRIFVGNHYFRRWFRNAIIVLK